MSSPTVDSEPSPVADQEAILELSPRLRWLRRLDLRAPFVAALVGLVGVGLVLVVVPAVVVGLWERRRDDPSWLLASMGAVTDGGVGTLTALLTVMIPLALVRLSRLGTRHDPDGDVPGVEKAASRVVQVCGAIAVAVVVVAVLDVVVDGGARLGTSWNVIMVGLVTMMMAVWLTSSVSSALPERRKHADSLIAGTRLVVARLGGAQRGRRALPWVWLGFDSMWFMVPIGSLAVPGWLGAALATLFGVGALSLPALIVWMCRCSRSDLFSRWLFAIYVAALATALDVVLVVSVWSSDVWGGVGLVVGVLIGVVAAVLPRGPMSLRAHMEGDALQMWTAHLRTPELARHALDQMPLEAVDAYEVIVQLGVERRG